TLRRCELLSADQLCQLDTDIAGQFNAPRSLTEELVSRRWLTLFQATQLLSGNCDDLIVGQYQLLDRLGEGGMGRVYKALHRPMNRVVALKVVRPDLLADPSALKRFQREVQNAALLSHPNIVTVFDANQIGTNYFLAMEYVNGVDLDALVRSG